MTFYVSPADLGTYLGATVDVDRAQFLIDRATELCQSVLNPLPDAAVSVVLDVVARAYSNPADVQAQTAGPFSAHFGKVSGGLWLTRQNKQTLRRLAGSGGAFSFDTMPAAAGKGIPVWDQNVWGLGSAGMYGGDWDQIP